MSKGRWIQRRVLRDVRFSRALVRLRRIGLVLCSHEERTEAKVGHYRSARCGVGGIRHTSHVHVKEDLRVQATKADQATHSPECGTRVPSQPEA